jgi:radical SAM protein with 4Fe4S-binding SPASM domain
VKRGEQIRAIARAPLLLWEILARGRYRFSYDLMDATLHHMAVPKRLNLVRSGLNLVHRRLSPWSWPLHMQIELTNYCNLRCPVCPTGSGSLQRKPQAMSVALLERLLAETAPYLLTSSLWAWGESLLHPQLREVLELFHRFDFTKLISTNGQNLTSPGVIDALLDYPPTYLIVAIDGMTDETNGRYRLGAKLASVLPAVRELARRKAKSGQKLPILHMRTIVMNHNQHEVPALEQFARSHGFDLLTLRALSVVEQPEQVHQAMIPNQPDLRAYDYATNERKQRSDFVCMQPFWFPAVLADGTVVSCEQDAHAELPLGRLVEGVSFGDIWFGPEAKRVRRILRDEQMTVGFCRQCPFRDHQYTSCSFKEDAMGNNLIAGSNTIPESRFSYSSMKIGAIVLMPCWNRYVSTSASRQSPIYASHEKTYLLVHLAGLGYTTEWLVTMPFAALPRDTYPYGHATQSRPRSDA